MFEHVNMWYKVSLTVFDSSQPVRCFVSGCGISSVLLWCLREAQ